MNLETVEIGCLGESKAGKTALAKMFASGGAVFPRDYHLTSGVEVFTKILTRVETEAGPQLFGADSADLITQFEAQGRAQHLKAKLFDFGGSEMYREAIVYPVLCKLRTFVLVFDLGNRESFEALERWKNEAEQRAEGECKWAVVGNKADLGPREVTEEEARGWARNVGAQYFETAAGDYDQVDQAFRAVILELTGQ